MAHLLGKSRLVPDVGLGLSPKKPSWKGEITTAVQRYWPHILWATFFATTITFLALFLVAKDGEYEPKWDTFPPSPTDSIMDCTGDPDAYWAAAEVGEGGSHATTRCVFTGDYTTGHGVSEEEVRAKCNAKHSCGGYTVRQTVRYATSAFAQLTGTCDSAEGGTLTLTGTAHGAIPVGYNRSMPEYTLVYRSSVEDLQKVTDDMLGPNRETRFTTYLKQS